MSKCFFTQIVKHKLLIIQSEIVYVTDIILFITFRAIQVVPKIKWNTKYRFWSLVSWHYGAL